MRIFLVLLILLLSVPCSWPQGPHAPIKYWKEAGINFEHLTTHFLNDENCYKAQANFIACLHAINATLLERIEQVVFPPGNWAKNKKHRLGEKMAEIENLSLLQVLEPQLDNPSLNDLRRATVEFHRLMILVWDTYLQSHRTDWKSRPFFNRLMAYVKKEFVKNEEQGIILASQAINHYLTISNDDMTSIIPDQALEEDQEKYRDENTVGTGMFLYQDRKRFLVHHTTVNSPARKAGILPMDIVSAVDGFPTRFMRLDSVMEKIERASEVSVQLTVWRQGRELKVNINKAAIEVDNVQAEVASFEGKKIGHLTLRSFMPQKSSQELGDKLRELLAAGIDGLVLDLRGNGGGILEEAVDIANFFLPKNSLIVDVRPINEEFEDTRRKILADKDPLTDLPLVVLVDGGSASGSELLAGALADHQRAILVGEKTVGKGTAQTAYQYKHSEKATILVTTSRYHLPKGRSIQLWGITPHLEVAQKILPESPLRLKDISINPVPVDQKTPVVYALPDEIRECLPQKGKADQLFKFSGAFRALDYQYLKAQDVLYCQLLAKLTSALPRVPNK
jgi:carboxyl-terminal processing protease